MPDPNPNDDTPRAGGPGTGESRSTAPASSLVPGSDAAVPGGSASGPKERARGGSWRSWPTQEAGAVEALRRLVNCLEQIVREIPRGAAAEFDGVREELRQVRKSLETGPVELGMTTPVGRAIVSRRQADGPRGSPGIAAGPDRLSMPDDDELPGSLSPAPRP